MRILILGAGAIGSNLSAYLAADVRDKHQITVLDQDAVEERNIRASTQLYLREQIGFPKTEALQYNIAKQFNANIETYTTSILFTNASRIVKDYDLCIDCFDNFEARRVITEACTTIPCVHVGFSPTFTWSVLWNEGYIPSEDAKKGFDICTMQNAASFVRLVASVGSLVVQDFLETGNKHEFVGARLSVRRII